MIHKIQSVKEFPENPHTKHQSHAETELIIVEKTAYNKLNNYLLIRNIIQQGGNYILENPNTPHPSLLYKYSYPQISIK